MCDPISIMAGGTILGTGVSAYGAYQSGKQADKYADSQGRLTGIQADIALDQWDRYVSTIAPIENKVAAEVSRPVENQGYFAKMMAGIDKGYSDASANVAKTTAANHQYGSGVGEARQATLDLSRTRDKASAYADAEKSRLANMMNVVTMGKGNVSSAQGGLSQAAGSYGNLATMYGNAAGSGWQSVGNAAGNLTQLYMMNKMAGGGSGGFDVPAGWGTYDSGTGLKTAWAN